jgi:hypothetical protein
MGNIPDCRLQPNTFPFCKTGVDYFGPMEVVVRRSREKRYGVLFTCLSTRAVHLELAGSLSTDSCIIAIRRFISRRGNPLEIHSDNGTNFKGAAVELKKAINEMDQEKIGDVCNSKGIQWHFIPPHAPHMGGCWERLVRSVKVALAAVLKERSPKEEVLMTLLIEVEQIVNSRPLNHVSLEDGSEEALTPNHFLIGRSSSAGAPGLFSEDDMDLRKLWRKSQLLADRFWQRWIKEYLPTLTRRTKWNSRVDPIQVGDVVIVVDDLLPRNSWPKGIIEELFPGKDGIVRVVTVRTATGTYRRPVPKICVLDVKKGEDSDSEPTPGGPCYLGHQRRI